MNRDIPLAAAIALRPPDRHLAAPICKILFSNGWSVLPPILTVRQNEDTPPFLFVRGWSISAEYLVALDVPGH